MKLKAVMTGKKIQWYDEKNKEITGSYSKGEPVYVEDSQGNQHETKARFLHYSGKIFRDRNGALLEGDTLKNGIIMRFHNGRLNGQGEPAIETDDCHLEYWDEGLLCEVVTAYMTWRERWKDNVLETVSVE